MDRTFRIGIRSFLFGVLVGEFGELAQKFRARKFQVHHSSARNSDPSPLTHGWGFYFAKPRHGYGSAEFVNDFRVQVFCIHAAL